jgi:hypothetical protein
MKKVIVVLLVLALVVGAGVWYFVSFRLDSLIETRIEQAGSASFGSRVSVGKVTTNIRDGSLQISGVTVANPPGFKSPNAFSLNTIEAAVDYANLDIKRLVIDQPDIVIEEMGGTTNFEQMLAEMDRMEAEAGPAGAGSDEPVIVLRHFRMNESRAAFQSESLDRYTDVEVDAVELHDLRGTPTEVARIIAREVLDEVKAEAAKEVLKAQVGKQYEEVEEQLNDALKDMLGAGQDPGDQ